MEIERMGHPSWAEYRYEPRKLAATLAELKIAVADIRRRQGFDAIAFRGMSGAAVAFPLSAELDIPVVCVRKPGESTHGYSVEGPRHTIGRYLIVDDLIDSGETIDAIVKQIDARCVGILLYGNGGCREGWGGIPIFYSDHWRSEVTR